MSLLPIPDLEPRPITFEEFMDLVPEKFEWVDGYLFDPPHNHLERGRLLAILLTNEGLVRTVQLAPPERWLKALKQAEEMEKPGRSTTYEELLAWVGEDTLNTGRAVEVGSDIMSVKIHPTAEVSEQAEIGEGTSIWHQSQVREGAHIGRNCILAKGVYVDAGVIIGDKVKVQNYVSIYHGVTIEDGVFCGPHCVFTNDKRPRAINPDGSLKAADDWTLSKTLVKRGAAIGANAVIVCGVTVGAWAMIGSGSVVSRDVPDYGLVWGNPARLHGFVCPCGERLEEDLETRGQGDTGTRRRGDEEMVPLRCSECGATVEVSKTEWENIE